MFTKKELNLINKLDTPAKIQDFLNKLPFNFEEKRETLKSPKRVLREGNAHCMEGALLGAWLLKKAGYKPYLMRLVATRNDFHHIITVFKEGRYFGALSKTNHYVLRYREPVYLSPRELAMSYFHEYFLNKNRQKTMRSFSALVSPDNFKKGWEEAENNLWYIDTMIKKVKHFDVIPKSYVKSLRLVDPIEVKAGTLLDFKPSKKKV